MNVVSIHPWRVVALIVASAIVGCEKDKFDAHRAVPPASVLAMETAAMRSVPTLIAQTESLRQGDIVARSSGFLHRFAHRQGKLVTEDKVPPAAASTVTLAAIASTAEPPTAVATRADGIEVHREGDTTIVDVQRVRGIGGVTVQVPEGGPQSVLFRFHDFPALESFKVRSARGQLDCESQRGARQPARTVCRMGGQEVDAVRISGNVIAVRIPEAVLREPGESAVVRWVDQWRW